MRSISKPIIHLFVLTLNVNFKRLNLTKTFFPFSFFIGVHLPALFALTFSISLQPRLPSAHHFISPHLDVSALKRSSSILSSQQASQLLSSPIFCSLLPFSRADAGLFKVLLCSFLAVIRIWVEKAAFNCRLKRTVSVPPPVVCVLRSPPLLYPGRSRSCKL